MVLCALLPPAANAQVSCDASLVSGVSLNPASGSRVVAGQTVTINYVKAGITAGSCFVTNGDSWLAYPDGVTVIQTESNYVLPIAPFQFQCTGTAGGGGAPCLAFPNTYVVNTNDVARTLQLGSPTVVPRRYAANGNNPWIFLGTPNQLHFWAATEGDACHDAAFTSPCGLAYGDCLAFLTVVHPGLTVSIEGDTNCFTYGAPISFHGSVCNSGDVPLVNITLTDTPAVPVTFAATTSSGRPFNPATGLTNGECVSFIGSYSPPNTGGASLCGPFTNTVLASGQANTVFQQPVYYATNSATCLVCSNPGIAVTKACPPVPVQPGGTLSFTGTVTNTGDIPLTSVLVFDDQPSPGTLVFGPAALAPGEGAVFSGSYAVPTNSPGPYIDTLTATGVGLCGSAVFNTFTAACPAQSVSPYTPPPSAVSISPQTNGGNVNVTVSVDLPDACHSVSDWGQPIMVGTNVYVDAQFWVTNTICAQVVTTISTNYSLGTLAPGDYTFSFQVWGNRVKSQEFSVPEPSPPLPVTITNVTVFDSYLQFSFPTQSNYTYTVQFTDLVVPAEWQVLTNFLGDGTTATVSTVITNGQQSFRVWIQ